MDLICYARMETPSRKLMKKRFRRRGQKPLIYHYNPQKRLVQRLGEELNMSEAQIRQQIAEERLYLLRQLYGDEISKKDV